VDELKKSEEARSAVLRLPKQWETQDLLGFVDDDVRDVAGGSASVDADGDRSYRLRAAERGSEALDRDFRGLLAARHRESTGRELVDLESELRDFWDKVVVGSETEEEFAGVFSCQEFSRACGILEQGGAGDGGAQGAVLGGPVSSSFLQSLPADVLRGCVYHRCTLRWACAVAPQDEADEGGPDEATGIRDQSVKRCGESEGFARDKKTAELCAIAGALEQLGLFPGMSYRDVKEVDHLAVAQRGNLKKLPGFFWGPVLMRAFTRATALKSARLEELIEDLRTLGRAVDDGLGVSGAAAVAGGAGSGSSRGPGADAADATTVASPDSTSPVSESGKKAPARKLNVYGRRPEALGEGVYLEILEVLTWATESPSTPALSTYIGRLEELTVRAVTMTRRVFRESRLLTACLMVERAESIRADFEAGPTAKHGVLSVECRGLSKEGSWQLRVGGRDDVRVFLEAVAGAAGSSGRGGERLTKISVLFLTSVLDLSI